MDVFDLRNKVIEEYSEYVRSFLKIRDERIDSFVQGEMDGGFLWPDPLVQLNPSFEAGDTLQKLVSNGELHEDCLEIFRAKREDGSVGPPFSLHRHQVEGIRAANAGDNFVLTTGTGSGKSLAYIVPIVNHVLRGGGGNGIQAIIVYPMNALANSQMGELEKFLGRGDSAGRRTVTFRRYTGQENDEERNEIIANPPDILLTNYVMLELVLTRPWDHQLIEAAENLRFLVLDELHTYRGRQGADVSMLARRLRRACNARNLIHIGTSATLVGGGSWEEQQTEVAKVASTLFGVDVKQERVIGETLRRATPAQNLDDPAFVVRLRARLQEGEAANSGDADALLEDPLSIWIESALGLCEEEDSDRLLRRKPRSLSGDDGVAAGLAEATGLERDLCESRLREALLSAYLCRDSNGHSLFAFRLHQFVSKGDSVYASPEPESTRHVTLKAQQFVPGSGRAKVLLPIAFCRECGQDYYTVRRIRNEDGHTAYVERPASDQIDNDDGEPGFLYICKKEPWPEDHAKQVERLPETWLETGNDGEKRVRSSQRKNLPLKVFISPEAVERDGGQVAWWLPSPFKFCLYCGVAYNPRTRSDYGKLATLGSGGRSTATTVMAHSTIRELREDRDISKNARKLLSFTDNRQDASLQAGHFNDFVKVSLLRSALWRAVEREGEEGIRHERLTRRVFDALSVPIDAYAANPDVKFAAREEADRALREVLGYYVYRDLQRGWRITSPNLEQCGLLKISYLSLDEFCESEEDWANCHPILAEASAAERMYACRTLLDFMRRELAIRVNFLDPDEQESIRQLSRQHLVDPWAIDENEKFERSRIVFPRSRGDSSDKQQRFVFLPPRGGFGQFFSRLRSIRMRHGVLGLDVLSKIIPQICKQLTIPGILHREIEPREVGDVPGYQLNSSALIWRKGSGSTGFHDPIRVPRAPADGLRANPFFSDFYRGEIDSIADLEAREHTAQVPGIIREEREEEFRKARLPILFCSPTMELGVDISELNVVNMRNVPPTPANYAQRSGRAGRSGQPAFVFTYCTAGSPHDQYFFKRPENMVAGSVTTPRLDLGNEDLIRAHVHAIWLGAAKLDLGKSLTEILDVGVDGDDMPTLDLLPRIKDALDSESARNRARDRAHDALGDAIAEMVGPDGDPGQWLDRVLRQLPSSFDRACGRWRGLYLAALKQSRRQWGIVTNPSRDSRDRDRAKRLRAEAEAQLQLLIDATSSSYSDFYSYRYFASEGFLPGYNFPRLPLSAFLPARRQSKRMDEFLTRPRFLAISEFGPRSVVYHEGSRYVINKAILPVDEDRTGDSVKRSAARCDACGYIHPLDDGPGPDLCENCKSTLPPVMDNLFRMQNVATHRRDRINSDEEERVRLGYELRTGIRFAKRGGVVSARHAEVVSEDGRPLATLVYGHGATLWRMNLGWRKRKDKDQTGYVLDIERGFWATNKVADAAAEDDPEDPMSPRRERVVPYVDDTRNCILYRPADSLLVGEMASLEAALKTAIQIHFQLEDRELDTEMLPSADDRKHILLYESAEGGAGVLRHLVDDVDALPSVARLALEIAHFDPDTGEDMHRPKGAREDCVAACYDCLFSYFNQSDHRLLDRQLLPDLLRPLLRATVKASPAPIPRENQLARLLRLCQSELERKWVRMVDSMGLKLPSGAQVLVGGARGDRPSDHGRHVTGGVRPDFLYGDEGCAIFVDGPPHDTPEQREKNHKQREDLENGGLTVIRFHHAEDWEAIFRRYRELFGTPTAEAKAAPNPKPNLEPDSKSVSGPATATDFDPEDFDPEWREIMAGLAEMDGVAVEPGEEVMVGARAIDLDLATLRNGKSNGALRLVDDARPTADDVAKALVDQGHRVLRVRSTEPGVIDRILTALEE